jgi:hypothetical protein
MRCALTAILFALSFAAAHACSTALPGGMLVESARYSVGFRTQPQKIAVGKHFSIDLAVCPKSGAQPPESLRVDAHMPEHRHGMNYKAEIVPAPEGRYRADGLMFHMPGRWEFMFDVRAGGRTDRLTQSVILE